MNPGTPGFSPPNAIDTIDHLRAMAGKTLGELAEHVLTTPKTSNAPNLLAYLYEREQEAAEDHAQWLEDGSIGKRPTPLASRVKSWAGMVVEGLCGSPANSRKGKDLGFLEIKTLGLLPKESGGFKVLEMLPLTTFTWQKVCDQEFQSADIRQKITQCLLVPIIKSERGRGKEAVADDIASFVLGPPMVFLPNESEAIQMGQEYEGVRSLVRSGNHPEVSSKTFRTNKWLLPNTAGSSNKDRTQYTDAQGVQHAVKTRKWFMPKRAVEHIIALHERSFLPFMDSKAKPVLKWAGGKRQLLPEIRLRVPSAAIEIGEIDTYVEPFFGGGAVFFDLQQRHTFARVIISDFNPDLTLVYRVIQSERVEQLIEHLADWQSAYHPLEHEVRADMFYRIRSEYNAMRSSIDLLGGLSDAHVQRAAMTIFLNRTCFNGLFRVNSNGDFNVPHGRYSRPDICNHSVLFAAHQALEGVEIRTGSYEVVDDLIGPRSLVYLDPPYRPLPGTTSFTDYIQKATFGDSDQRKLAEHYRSWDARGASLILSNSDPKTTDPADDFFDDLYQGFHIERVEAKRAINSDGAGRGRITELLITNPEREG